MVGTGFQERSVLPGGLTESGEPLKGMGSPLWGDSPRLRGGGHVEELHSWTTVSKKRGPQL